MASFESTETVLADVASECGLGALAGTWTSADANVAQLRTLLKRVGRGLVKRHSFLQNRLEHTFTTTTATTYPYPAGFLALVDDAGWNRTAQTSLVPLSPPGWQRLKATSAPMQFDLLFRPTATGIELHTAPSSGQTVAYAYRSRFWVQPASVPPVGIILDAPISGSDTLWIDSHLLTRALRHAFLAAKGFDASDALEDLREALDAEMSVNGVAAPVLSWTQPAPVAPFANNPISVNVSTGGGAGFGVLY